MCCVVCAAVDVSSDLCWALVEPGPAKPPPMNELQGFMASPPAAKVPITRRAMQRISGHPISAHFAVVEGSALADAVGHSICHTPPAGSVSEISTAILEDTAVVQVAVKACCEECFKPHLPA
jgi:hypothetical protein